MRGVPWMTVRQWRAARMRLLQPASTLGEALATLPPLSAGPSAYFSLWARVRPRPSAKDIEAIVAQREVLVPQFVHGLGDLLVPPRLVAPFAAVRLYRLRRDLRRSKRLREQELRVEEEASALLPNLSKRPTPATELREDTKETLDQLCSRGRVAKFPEAGPLDGRWSYALSPVVQAEAEAHADGWSFLEDLALHFFKVAGPATRDDFAWWSGATGAAARRTIEELVGSLEEVDLEGGRQAHFMLEEEAGRLRRFAEAPSTHAALLPSLDPIRFAWRVGAGALAGTRVAARLAPVPRRRAGAIVASQRTVVVGGSPVATWSGSAANLQVEPFGTPDDDIAYAIEVELKRVAALVEDEIPWADGVRSL